MITLYHSPLMRSVRIYWLLEELRLPYRLETLTFTSLKSPAYKKVHPLGKVPAIQDGDLTMFESGAILEYILEEYGNGRLAPAPGTSRRAMFLQWVHFAEATAFPPIGDVVAHTLFRPEAERIPAVVADGRTRAAAVLGMLEQALAGKRYLLGAEFTAADIMMGLTLLGAKWHGLLPMHTPTCLRTLSASSSDPRSRRHLREVHRDREQRRCALDELGNRAVAADTPLVVGRRPRGW